MLRRALLPFALLAAACYSTQPMTTAPAPSAEVRVTLTDSGTLNLVPQLGPNAGELLGHLLAAPGDSLQLSIIELQLRSGEIMYQRGTLVRLARTDASRISVRTFNRQRTVLAIVAGALGATALLTAAVNAGVFGGSGDGGVVTPP